MTRKLTFFFFLLCLGLSLSAQDVTIRDGDLVGDTDYVWDAGTTYLLDGLVYLESGSSLTIPAGTVIKGAAAGNITTGDNTSALIITRGARIFANGTASAPVIFTAEEDDLSVADDFTAVDRGEWGGLIILGNGVIARPGGEDGVEGIDADEDRAKYGGDDNEDSSGSLTYVSIRHGGSALSPNNEINGLTLGGVGSGTFVDFIEVFANFDDGIEFFGGAVEVKHASVSFCGDDAFDYDYGYRGKGQFWFSLQGAFPNAGTGRAGEHDGASPDDEDPFSSPTIYNATYIGIGEDATAPAGDAADALTFSVLLRDNAGGFYNNSIFTDFNGAAIAIEDRDDTDDGDAFSRFEAGDLAFNGNVFENFQAGDAATDLFIAVDADESKVDASTAVVAAGFTANNNVVGETGIAGIGRAENNELDPRLNADSDLLGGATPSDDDFFNQVTFRGAFGNSNNWLEGWTALAEYGYLGDLVTPINTTETIMIRDGDLVAGETYNWNGGDYTLDGLVFLEAGATLNIAAGTVIRGLNANNISTGDNTSALIITKDATINAIGTESEPIIFTAADDDLEDDEDFSFRDRGEWGGLIILGNATIARPGGSDGIEGIDADEVRAEFGGDDDEDSSGRLQYVSIRHGGAALSPNNEINGLTLGGVGSGTLIDFVEVFANFDDGIEFFGGTVSVNHAAVAFCGDDSYDYDFGWRGGGQYWFSLQDASVGTGRAGEHDGASPDNQASFSNPTIVNATYVGIGESAVPSGGDAADGLPFAVLFRDNAAGTYANSVFYGFNGAAIAVEDRSDEVANDSYARFLAGDLQFMNNYFFNFGRGDAAGDIFLAVNADESPVMASSIAFSAAMAATGNVVLDPEFNNEDREEFDPRPVEWAAAASAGEDNEVDGFEATPYVGAFVPGNGSSSTSPKQNWLTGWSAVTETSAVVEFLSSTGDLEQGGLRFGHLVPNPASEEVVVNFELPRAAQVTVTLIDMLGRPMGQISSNLFAGEQRLPVNVSNLPNGSYVVMIDAGGNRITQKLVVRK